MAILPVVLMLIGPDVLLLRIFRLLRMLRLARLGRFSAALDYLAAALHRIHHASCAELP